MMGYISGMLFLVLVYYSTIYVLYVGSIMYYEDIAYVDYSVIFHVDMVLYLLSIYLQIIRGMLFLISVCYFLNINVVLYLLRFLITITIYVLCVGVLCIM